MWYHPILKEVVFFSDTCSSVKISACNSNEDMRKSVVLATDSQAVLVDRISEEEQAAKLLSLEIFFFRPLVSLKRSVKYREQKLRQRLEPFCFAATYWGKGNFWVISSAENVCPVFFTGTLEEQQHQFSEQRRSCNRTRRDYHRFLPTGFRYVLSLDVKGSSYVDFGIKFKVIRLGFIPTGTGC